jgi:FtsP/CotA-like multicopper oxidase with cupredoxin domain
MEVGPIELKRGDRMRFVLINDTMMEHPIHLHGLERDRRGNSRPISASSTRGDSGKPRVFARQASESTGDVRFVFGARVWF